MLEVRSVYDTAGRAMRVQRVAGPDAGWGVEDPSITVGTDGKLTVTLTPTRAPDIQISRLMIAQTS